jgi:hypothetical protein
MRSYNAPRPPYRWQLGLLLLSLPRRFIAGRFRDVLPGGADELVPYPVGHARPRQLGGPLNHLLMLRGDADEEGGGVAPFRCLAHGLKRIAIR